MLNFSSLRVGQPSGRGQQLVALWSLLLLLLGLGRPEAAHATHIRAGDIQARVDTTAPPGDPRYNPRRIFFRLTVYTDSKTPSGVLEKEVHIFFGDGTCTPENGLIPRSTDKPIPISDDTDINYFYFEHVYPSNGKFTISYIGENRNAPIRNIDGGNSISVKFYVSTTITIDPALGANHSPVLKAPPVDRGAIGQVFLHNPGAFDADGDSLSFHLRECQDVPLGVPGLSGSCLPVPQVVKNFQYPNAKSSSPNGKQVPYTGNPPSNGGGDAIFVQDRRTGQITWNAPGDAGIYNVAFVVEEWRRTGRGATKIGEVIRDMQIIVKASTNLRPAIKIPNDTCVIAGATVIGNVTATDPTAPGFDPPSPLTFTVFSGILPPATFKQTLTGPPLAKGQFVWTTDCNNVASEPYQVLFRVQDKPATGDPLIDERVWRITVVGPPPQNLQAAAGPTGTINSALLTWDRYICQTKPGTKMLIYRKEGPSTFNPGPCDTGIPAGLGYQQIGSISADLQSFKDDNGGNGLQRGKTYCYRIYAVFPLPAGGASIASKEACVSFDGRDALLTNVDVDQTSTTAGQITVRWTRPVAPLVQGPFVPPYSYRLSRTEGLTPGSFTVVYTTATLTDTVFVDQKLNTQDKQYTYKLEFLAKVKGQDYATVTPTASSVRVTGTPRGLTKSIVVSWTYNVPWDNSPAPTRIFRRPDTGGAFVEIATAPSAANGGTYTDADPSLQFDRTYCYYVQTEGRYSNYPDLLFLQKLLNKSQQQCVPLTSEPCAPVLRPVTINCDSLGRLPIFPEKDRAQSYDNRLSWTLGDTPAGCSNKNIRYFRIFSSTNETDEPVLRDSTRGLEFSYVFRNLTNNAACYQVQAVDAAGRRSPKSNKVCVDACQVFILPNIFTPNGDKANDKFRPKVSSPVKHVRFQAFNRWGVKVYEGDQDPLINWDGGGLRGESSNSTVNVSDGVYYYLAEVEFDDFKHTRRTYKGWVEIVR